MKARMLSRTLILGMGILLSSVLLSFTAKETTTETVTSNHKIESIWKNAMLAGPTYEFVRATSDQVGYLQSATAAPLSQLNRLLVGSTKFGLVYSTNADTSASVTSNVFVVWTTTPNPYPSLQLRGATDASGAKGFSDAIYIGTFIKSGVSDFTTLTSPTGTLYRLVNPTGN